MKIVWAYRWVIDLLINVWTMIQGLTSIYCLFLIFSPPKLIPPEGGDELMDGLNEIAWIWALINTVDIVGRQLRIRRANLDNLLINYQQAKINLKFKIR
ncbi:hypothetical protein [Archaeoglobus sp.]